MKVEICEEFYYRVVNQDLDIFKEYNSCKENVLRNNSNIKFYNGEWIKIKVNNYITHFVLPTETVDSISKKYNIDAEKLLTDNNLGEKRLFIGQMLKVYN